MVEGKKKRSKLKKVLKGNTNKMKQVAKQSTNISIKIGGDKKKKRKPAQRLQRRPHMRTNSMYGAVQYTPPPGYYTPQDFLRALPPPPPPPALPPPLPVPPLGAVGVAAGAAAGGVAPVVGAGVGGVAAVAPLRQPVAPIQPPRARARIIPGLPPP